MKGLIQMKDKLKPTDVVVVLFHDHGSRYVGKMFNDDWMRERGFLEENNATASDLVASHKDEPLVTLFGEELVSHAIMKMRKFNISQIPVMKDNKFVGSIDDAHLFQVLVDNPNLRDMPVSSVMQAPLPIVKSTTPMDVVSKLINKEVPAVLVEMENGNFHILTKHDIIQSIA